MGKYKLADKSLAEGSDRLYRFTSCSALELIGNTPLVKINKVTTMKVTRAFSRVTFSLICRSFTGHTSTMINLSNNEIVYSDANIRYILKVQMSLKRQIEGFGRF